MPLIGWCDRGEGWENDLDTFYSVIKSKHISPFAKISEQELQNEILTLKKDAKINSDAKVTLELMKLTRKIGDGHTAVHFQNNKKLKKFPIDIYDDSGVWRVIGVSKKHKAILGSQLTHIGKHSVQELRAPLSKVVQFVENENSLQQRSAQYIRYSEILFELGLINDSESAAFTFFNGTEKTVVELKAKSSEVDLLRYSVTSPKIDKIQNAGVDDLWYGNIPNSNAIYIKFGQSPSFEQMDEFGKSLLTYINKKKISQLIIDLRGNWGGDFYVGVWLAYYLNLSDTIDWLHGVYTLVDKDTFSAATINAVQFKQLLNAKIVGEPTGSNPSGVQDMDTFKLPYSGLIISYSKRMFRLQEKSDKPLTPDVEVKYSWESYVAGEDNILMWVLNDL